MENQFHVLFCGLNHFQRSFELTRDELSADESIIVTQCELSDIDHRIQEADVVVPRMGRLPKETLEKATRLKLVMQYGVGLEGVDIETATQLNIAVSKIHSEDCSNALSCAEHAIFLALAVFRDQNALMESIKIGRLGVPTGRTLFGSRAILFGFGGIGKQLAPRLKAFHVHTTAVIRRLPEDMGDQEQYRETYHLDALISTQDFHSDERRDLVSEADLLFVCCNQNADNIGMVNKEFLSKLKTGVVIINVARVSISSIILIYKCRNKLYLLHYCMY